MCLTKLSSAWNGWPLVSGCRRVGGGLRAAQRWPCPPGAGRRAVARPSPDRLRGRQRAAPRGRYFADRARRCVDCARSVAAAWDVALQRLASIGARLGAAGEPLGLWRLLCCLGRITRLPASQRGCQAQSSPGTALCGNRRPSLAVVNTVEPSRGSSSLSAYLLSHQRRRIRRPSLCCKPLL